MRCASLIAVLFVFAHADALGRNLLQERARTRRTDPVGAVTGLVKRWFPDHLTDFEFSVIAPLPDGRDVYEYANAASGSGAVISISGSSGVALASGLYAYLKDYCHVQMSWNGDNLALPSTLPAVSGPKRVERGTLYSYYQNVCTVSYSMAWWKWGRWQREIDWMALNGINMPLAFTGQEFIWMKTYEDFGLSFAELADFFSGPAFFAWQRMGNIQGWGGPLTMNFIMDSYELQLQILDRMREFDMIPVLPAFAGHIPGAIQTHYPSANITRSANWGNFNSTYGSDFLLEANDPLYQKLGARFIELQTLYYGTDHVYNCDTFNEMRPASSDPAYLKASSQAVYKSMTAADPQAVWLMQGWLFYEDSAFWQPPQVEALLSGVPNEGMIVLDLYSDYHPLWQQTHNYYGKPWIWCTLHDFGGTVSMSGNLSAIATGPLECLAQENCTMVGVGLTMEGIDQNYIVYDLTMEMSWHGASQPLNVTDYVADFVLRRYGASEPAVLSAWETLAQSVYNVRSNGVPKTYVELSPSLDMVRPDFMPTAIHYDPNQLLAAWASLLSVADAAPFASSETYLFDLVDVTRQALCNLFQQQHDQLVALFQNASSTAAQVEILGAEMVGLLVDLDGVLASNSHFLLGTWIADARAWGHSAAEADWLEFNARNQLTLWGPRGEINDYASKLWSGLVGDYYMLRWSAFVSTLVQNKQAGEPFDPTAFYAQSLQIGAEWGAKNSTRQPYYPAYPQGDTVALVKAVAAKYFPSLGL